MIPALQTRGLVVGYGRGRATRAVLGPLSVSVEPGELVSVLGVNGIGKSTLLRTLARSQPALAGRVEIGGTDISALSNADLARRVGVLLTERIAVGAMTGLQLVELGRYPHTGWSGQLSEQDRAAVADAIAAVGGQHLEQREVNALSDGERQRIMIARALAQRPALLLLDEPAAFLDVAARVDMLGMLRRLAREQGVAVILSSHDLDLSLRLSDTIWLLDGNGGIEVGAPEDLLAKGNLDAAFSSETIAFSAAKRTFRLREKARGTAHVSGANVRVDLARTVLEREGLEMVSEAENAILRIVVGADDWVAERGNERSRGTNFAELARFVRRPLEASGPELPN